MSQTSNLNISEAHRKRYRTIREHNLPRRLRIVMTDHNGVERSTEYVEKEWARSNGVGGLRYGENPEQGAALYVMQPADSKNNDGEAPHTSSLYAHSKLLQSGKHPSKTNICDIDVALHILRYNNDYPCAVIMKHNNPSAVAIGADSRDAIERAYTADSRSAFGAVVVLNREIDIRCAEFLIDHYFEMIVAPCYTDKALAIMAHKKNMRIMEIGGIASLHTHERDPHAVDIRSLNDGSLCIQEFYLSYMSRTTDFVAATAIHNDRQYTSAYMPSVEIFDTALFGWHIVEALWSNAAIFVRGNVTVGIGCGAVDRVGAVQIAINKARTAMRNHYAHERFSVDYDDLTDEQQTNINRAIDDNGGPLSGATLISDGFFPFVDAIKSVAGYGLQAIVAPGGSVRDWEIIEYCNSVNIPLLFSKQRAFRH